LFPTLFRLVREVFIIGTSGNACDPTKVSNHIFELEFLYYGTNENEL
jgi:hypothetical protein